MFKTLLAVSQLLFFSRFIGHSLTSQNINSDTLFHLLQCLFGSFTGNVPTFFQNLYQKVAVAKIVFDAEPNRVEAFDDIVSDYEFVSGR